jgi:hypothetical protein
MIGVLASCICCYPDEVDATTASGHDPRCPAHAMRELMLRAEAG